MSEVLRIVAGGLIALVCAYVGVLVKRRYRAREKFYGEALEYFNFFERELTFKKTPMPDINSAFSKSHAGEFAQLLCEPALLDKKSAYAYLKQAEKDDVKDALKGLGVSVYNEQLSYVKRWQAEMQESADKCGKENKKYGGMYFKLCVLLGIALLILIV